MKSPRALFLCSLLMAVPSTFAEKANPMGTVLSLINDLTAKITAEGEAEAKAYKEYFEWCDSTSKNGNFEIKTLTSQKEKLEATIEKATSEIAASTTRIDELASSIAEDEAELKSATEVRNKEAADFATAEAELVDTVDTLGRAVGILNKEMSNSAFTQVDTSSVDNLVKALGTVMDAASFSIADKQKLVALVQSKQGDSSDDLEFGAPAADTYKSHSGNIVDILEDMKEKAEEELDGLRKAETSAKHNFEMLKQSLVDQITADTNDKDEETSSRAANSELKATSESDLASTVKDLDDANQALATCHSTCMQTASDHSASVAGRTEELKALSEAKKILSETSGGAVEQSYSLLQQSSQKFGARLRTRTDLANAEVTAMVKRLAQKHHSAALAQLASKIAAVIAYGQAAGEDPFAKVKGLISDLIAKLEEEALSEANEKAYCDEQMSKTEAKKGELNHDLDKLVSKIDQAASASAGLKAEVKELQAELAKLAQEQAELDAIRQETHADYVKAKADLELGLEGVRKALSVLREYYGGAAAGAAGAALVQSGEGLGAMMRQPATPEFHASHSGSGGGIIDILQVCESDFAKGLAEEETEEADAESEYQAVTFQNKQTKTIKDQDVKYKSQESAGLDKSIAELSADKETTSTELSAVLEYYAKIKDRCIAKPETYAERKGRREAEIAGLKEALTTLENETAFMQRGKRGRKSHFLSATA